MYMSTIAALNILSNDNSFIADILNLDSIADIKKAFASKGVELSEEEVTEIVDAVLNNVDQAQQGEIDEQALETVVGGSLIAGFFCAAVAVAVTHGVASCWRKIRR